MAAPLSTPGENLRKFVSRIHQHVGILKSMRRESIANADAPHASIAASFNIDMRVANDYGLLGG